MPRRAAGRDLLGGEEERTARGDAAFHALRRRGVAIGMRTRQRLRGDARLAARGIVAGGDAVPPLQPQRSRCREGLVTDAQRGGARRVEGEAERAVRHQRFELHR